MFLQEIYVFGLLHFFEYFWLFGVSATKKAKVFREEDIWNILKLRYQSQRVHTNAEVRRDRALIGWSVRCGLRSEDIYK